MKTSSPLTENEIVQYLILSALAVNSFSLRRVWVLKDRLDAQGLFDLKRVAPADPDAIAARLALAGYNRGSLTFIIAPRLVALAGALTPAKQATIASLLAEGKMNDLARVLLALPGIGPTVLHNFLTLRES